LKFGVLSRGLAGRMPFEKSNAGRGTKTRTEGMEMNIGIYEHASTYSKDHDGEQISDRRLWTAVLLQALEDWRSTSVWRQMEAERFLFQSQKDFATVCRGAGLDADSVLSKLHRMKRVALKPPTIQFQRVA